MRTRLIVFAKLAVEGRVKTRLAASIGSERALQVHRRLVEVTLALARASGADTFELRYDAAGAAPGSVAAALPEALLAEGWRVGPQRGTDLGERMREALDAALAAGERPVLVGSDCPALRPADLRDAFDALAATDAVFAPAEGVRLVSDRHGEDFLEVWLDTALDPPQVATRVNRIRGRNVTTTEGQLRADAPIGALADEDVLAFLLANIGPLVER